MTHWRASIGLRPPRTAVCLARLMFCPSTKTFFLYGLAIAGLEEFITQGVLKGS